MPLRGLTLLVASADPARFRSALEIAATEAALGAPVRLFLQTAAVPLLANTAEDDERHVTAGLPTQTDLLGICFELGVEIMLCQSGLALTGFGMDELDQRFSTGGLAGLLAAAAEDRLLAV